MPISLEFAFLAEWARAEEGATLTAASAGITSVNATKDEPFILYVAGAFRRTDGDPGHEFRLELTGPDGKTLFSNSAQLLPAGTGDGFGIGRVAFAIRLPISTNHPGQFSITLFIEDSQVAVLPLTIAINDSNADES